ncbi:uncharacterized protein LAJ45_00979 [Morchella importuna]|uniref:uncharacterized protein n=1 Tax=Morchella importuna TaxID=1174673 RepID=UPI001E8DBF8D|nr:uncharacterized protein LAJ45_00979 [Morchella importuna]KAH8154452.1 hypothetical protein LAJ45_00979 [Morchella importuna]
MSITLPSKDVTSAELALFAKNLEEVTNEIAAIVQANSDFRHEYNQAIQRQRIYTKMLININDNHEPSGQNRCSEDPAADTEYALYYRKKHQEEIDKLQGIHENITSMFTENNKVRSQAVLDIMGFRVEREEKERERSEKERLVREKEENQKLIGSLLAGHKDVNIKEQLEILRIEDVSSTPPTADGVALFTRPQRDALAAGLERVQSETELWIQLLQKKGHKPIGNIATHTKALLMKDREAVEAAESRNQHRQLTDSQIRFSIFRLGDVYKYMEQDQFKLWRIAGKYVEPKEEDDLDPKAFARPKDWKSNQPCHT